MTTFLNEVGAVWFDGEFIDVHDANIPVLTHGLHYASCVYEGERAYGGRVFRMREHTERLLRSAQLLDMVIPYTAEEIESATRELLLRNNIREGYVRPVAWRGSDTIATAAPASRVHVAIAAWNWPSYYPSDAIKEGIDLTVSRWRRPDPRSSPIEAKGSGHYMVLTLCKHEALNEGFDDALLLDCSGFIAEASSANIFFAKNNALHTPRAGNILSGITRRTVIEIAMRNGIEVVERDIRLQELSEFQEAFLTGTACEIVTVGRIDDIQYGASRLCEEILESFKELCRTHE